MEKDDVEAKHGKEERRRSHVMRPAMSCLACYEGQGEARARQRRVACLSSSLLILMFGACSQRSEPGNASSS